jgi:hypothetical protein
LNLNLENLPTPESLNVFRDGEEDTALKNKIFSVSKVRKYFRTFQALGAADIDGWRGREHVLSLFTNNDTELHRLILDELIFPYVTGEFLPQFLPELPGAFCLRFSRKMAVFALFCMSQSGADAQLGSPAIVRETLLTNISPPHIQILCNAQVAFKMVPQDARSCLTCSMICPRTTKTLTILSPSSTPTSRRLFKKCANRPPLTRSLARLQSHMMMGGCSLVMTSPSH